MLKTLPKPFTPKKDEGNANPKPPKARIQWHQGRQPEGTSMRKLLTIAAMLVLGGCAAPQEGVLKQMPSASAAPASNPVNCTTTSERMTRRTICN
jgi:hypothetical protein